MALSTSAFKQWQLGVSNLIEANGLHRTAGVLKATALQLLGNRTPDLSIRSMLKSNLGKISRDLLN